MVKKLFKHEFLSYIRIMGVVYIILLTVAAAGRIIQCFENDSLSYGIISGVSSVTYGVSVFCAIAFAFALAIIRFYKNLFTSEGYLTFTLPVTPAQHILVKVITAVSVMLITLLAVLLSACIMALGEPLSEIVHGLFTGFAESYKWMGFHAVILVFESVILFLLGLFASIMLYYTFISIGQLFKKNRILAAVGAYFVYYLLTQILSTIFLVVFAVSAATDGFQEFLLKLGNFVTEHPYIFLHSGAGIAVLLICAFILVEFVVIKKIITKKLNLE